jgi:hypothetical protein
MYKVQNLRTLLYVENYKKFFGIEKSLLTLRLLTLQYSTVTDLARIFNNDPIYLQTLEAILYGDPSI